jgi:hypothetical protein
LFEERCDMPISVVLPPKVTAPGRHRELTPPVVDLVLIARDRRFERHD